MTSAGVVAVEEVTGGKSMVRFVELPQVLHGHDPRWAPPVMAWERYRLDPHRNPYFERGDGVYLLARRMGQPVGRIAAHLPEAGGQGRFGFFSCIDDVDVATALVDAAQVWLREQGCSSMTGPRSFEADDEPGVLAAGFDVPGVTGRPWQPPWEVRLLETLGFATVDEQPTWRLPASDGHVAQPPYPGESKPADIDPDVCHRDLPRGDPAGQDDPRRADLPGQAGPYVDRRLLLPGVAAVPDVADALRHSSFRTAWRLARRARAGNWDTATVVRCSVDPCGVVPALCAVAHSAGYRWVVAPWSPDPAAPPETVHRIVRRTW